MSSVTSETDTFSERDSSAKLDREQEGVVYLRKRWTATLGSTLYVFTLPDDPAEILGRAIQARVVLVARQRAPGIGYGKFISGVEDLAEDSTRIPYMEWLTPFASDSSESRFFVSDTDSDEGSDIEPLPTTPPTGRPDVDARMLVWRVRNVNAAIALSRSAISSDVADRLLELWSEPRDVEAGEESLHLESLQWFLDYLLRRGKKERPLIGMTPDGIIEGHWQPDENRQLTIRFFGDGTVWVAVRDYSRRGSFEILAPDLLTDGSLIHIPNWA